MKNLLYLLPLLFMGCSSDNEQQSNSFTETKFLNLEITRNHHPISPDGWSPNAAINDNGTIAAVFEKEDQYGMKYLYLKLENENIKISHKSDIKNPKIDVLNDGTFVLICDINGTAKSGKGFQKIDPCILHFDQDGKMIDWIPKMNAFSFSHEGVSEFIEEVTLGEKSIRIIYEAKKDKNNSNLVRIKYNFENLVAKKQEYIKIIGKENSDFISATVIDDKIQTVTKSYTTPLNQWVLFDNDRSYSAEIFSFNFNSKADSMLLPEPSFIIDTTNRLEIQRIIEVNNNEYIIMHKFHEKGGDWQNDTYNFLKLKSDYSINTAFGFQGRVFQIKNGTDINDFAVDEKFIYLLRHNKNKNGDYVTEVLRYDLATGNKVEYKSSQSFTSPSGVPWINDAMVTDENLKFVSVDDDKVYEYNFNIETSQLELNVW
ncbi:hypothetical protein ABWH96_20540 [Marivirga tractuosa]|uniref:hypothetical protein n=1 Tax=Marivirga tractuosa TaxID=1006 RepID=UPI0035CF0CA0